MKLGQKVSFTSKEEFQKVLRKGYKLIAFPDTYNGLLGLPWEVWENNNLYLCKYNAEEHEIKGLYKYLIQDQYWQVIEVPSSSIKFTV